MLPVLALAATLLAGVDPTPAADAAGATHAEAFPAAPDGAPNIVVINTDDQRADSIRHLPRIQEWLVAGGTRFVNGYASIPSCCPSRSTLLTGRLAHNNGQTTQRGVGFDVDLTIQRYLHDGGYFTGHIGKYIHDWPPTTVAPHWDRWAAMKPAGYFDAVFNVDGVSGPSSGYSTDVMFDHATEFVEGFERDDDAKPFFLHVNPYAPHLPADPAPEYEAAPVSRYAPTRAFLERDRSDKPPFVRWRQTTAAAMHALHDRRVRTLYSVDAGVDDLLTRLDKLGELANTLVVYTSDNGFLLGEHHLRSKFLPYRASVQVPFLVRWPGRVTAGAVDGRFVTHADIAPTLLDAAGLSQSYVAFDGKSFLGPYVRRTAFMEYFHDTANSFSIPHWASLRKRRYQYTEYYTKDGRSTVTFREYYDLLADPDQRKNLLRDGKRWNDPNVPKLSALLRQQMRCAGASCL